MQGEGRFRNVGATGAMEDAVLSGGSVSLCCGILMGSGGSEREDYPAVGWHGSKAPCGEDVMSGDANNRHTAGMATRRRVLGDAHVDRAEAAKTAFDQPFQDLIVEGAWGTVWSDDTITHRDRSMLTLALLAATGNFEEIPMHIRATANTGATKDDVMQAFLHVAIYAGVPKANHAIKLAKATYAEMEGETS